MPGSFPAGTLWSPIDQMEIKQTLSFFLVYKLNNVTKEEANIVQLGLAGSKCRLRTSVDPRERLTKLVGTQQSKTNCNPQHCWIGLKGLHRAARQKSLSCS